MVKAELEVNEGTVDSQAFFKRLANSLIKSVVSDIQT